MLDSQPFVVTPSQLYMLLPHDVIVHLPAAQPQPVTFGHEAAVTEQIDPHEPQFCGSAFNEISQPSLHK
jgi:hypothetical protein